MLGRRLPISIHPLFWLFAALIGWMSSQSLLGTLLWIIVILVSVVVHELGHAITGLLFKQKVRIELLMFGGATYREGPRLSLFKEFLLTLNGPLAGFALGGLAYAVAHLWQAPPLPVAMALRIFFFVNIFWSAINLLPILPLDGGHLLRIVLEALFGYRGTKIALLVGVVLGTGLAIFFFISGYLIGGAVFFLLTFESFRAYLAYRNATAADRDEKVQHLFQEGQQLALAGSKDEAIKRLEELRAKTGRGLLFVAATETLAKLYSDTGQPSIAYRYLQSIRKQLSPSSLPLLQQLAFDAGDYDTVVRVGKECFQMLPTYKVALTTAFAHAARKESLPAVGWLECAIREGLPNAGGALRDPLFDPIRKDPKFQALVEKAPSDNPGPSPS